MEVTKVLAGEGSWFHIEVEQGLVRFAGNLVKLVNGEISLAGLKLSAWAKLNDKAWQVWKNAKGSSCLPYIG